MYCQPHSGILIGTLSQATLLPPPMSPHVENPHSMSWRNRECQHDLLRQELNNRFLVQSSEGRSRGPSSARSPLAPVSLLRGAFHQHQHMHQHQHTHQHTFTPFPPSLPPAAIITPPTAPPMVRTPVVLCLPHVVLPLLPPHNARHAPAAPHSGPFSSLQGAFQPKSSNPIDVASRPGAVPHTLLQKDPRSFAYFQKPGKWCAVHVQIAWQIYHHQQKMKQMQVDPHKLDMNGKLDLFSRPPAPGVFPGFPYTHDLARPMFSSTGQYRVHRQPPSTGHRRIFFLIPVWHFADPFSRSSTFGGLGNLSTSAFGGLGNPSLGSNSIFGHKEGPGGLPGFGSPHHDTWNRLHRTPPSFPTPPQWPKSADAERSNSVNSHEEREREREKRDSSISKEEKDKDRCVFYMSTTLNHFHYQNSSDSGRHHSASVDRVREAEKELLERHREAAILGDVKVKESRSPGGGKEVSDRDRRSSEDPIKPAHRTPSPYPKAVLSETGMKMAGGPPPTLLKDGDRDRKEGPPSSGGDLLLHKVKNDMKIKEERKEDQEQPPPPSPRCSDLPTHGSLHGVHMAHSLPLSMSAMHQMGSLNVLDRARMAPFMGVSPLAAAAGRDRMPHQAFPWDPLREAYRNLDLQRRMDFQLRAEQAQRFPSMYEQERAYREREAHDYSHHEHMLEVRREHERMRQQAEERERQHLREELDRARLHQLHQSPMEGHLPHMPPFMPHLGGMPYPRLSPSTGHNGLLNRTPPTAALTASPEGLPPHHPGPRDYSPSRNPKEVEAR
uniref:Fibrosin-like 1 n=1 Tax=Oncorhynchus tshawytscha TaxID=74940 RepID=A0AAZ3Q1L2_ONCTS